MSFPLPQCDPARNILQNLRTARQYPKSEVKHNNSIFPYITTLYTIIYNFQSVFFQNIKKPLFIYLFPRGSYKNLYFFYIFFEILFVFSHKGHNLWLYYSRTSYQANIIFHNSCFLDSSESRRYSPNSRLCNIFCTAFSLSCRTPKQSARLILLLPDTDHRLFHLHHIGITFSCLPYHRCHQTRITDYSTCTTLESPFLACSITAGTNLAKLSPEWVAPVKSSTSISFCCSINCFTYYLVYRFG